MKSENPVFAIGAWINPNAKSRPVSIMLEQKGEATNLIGFMMGQRNRKVATVSFSEDVASSIGINVSELQEGYDNVTPINFNMSEIMPFETRLKIVESTDESWAKENYAQPKLAGKDGVQLVTSDGEVIYRKVEWVQVTEDGTSDDILVAHIPVKEMGAGIKENAELSTQPAKEVF